MAANNFRLEKLKTTMFAKGSMRQAMLAAGYSAKYASQPGKIRSSLAYKKAMKPLLARLEEARDAALKRMAETVNSAEYSDVTNGLDRVQKQIQLLNGQATEQTKIVLVPSDVLDRHASQNGIDVGSEADSQGQAQIQSGELRP